MVAPRPKPGKGKRRAENRSVREFASSLVQRNTSGGIFEFKFAEAKVILPLAVVYSVKLILSNLSFAYVNQLKLLKKD